MFQKILIANRGEIACRVIRTARRMGIATVAVYSEADAWALHALEADEALLIGPAAASESYLSGERILEAARTSGADAIHPGYGFLSENAEFAESCAEAGITFIGPSPDAMRAMGLKDAAKKCMEGAGVPVVPGYYGRKQDLKTLSAAAKKIGYPVLIKAVAGGGGKGMRLVEKAKDFEASLASARREAKSAFGNDKVLVEKFITAPRHIEIQVFGDSAGNAVHLFERDCSIQRRHQKVIEEAPAPGMSEAMRAKMGAAAVTAVKAIAYEGAGTIEFIVDAGKGLADADFFFMEMNTRLQVEHPVTEMITGLDLVEWQIRVAAGEPLPLAQKDITLNGHAIEVRLYAEDPAKDFLPASGTLHAFRTPAPAADLRVETGIAEGDAVSIYYDPMIAKIVAHGDSRDEAMLHLTDALKEIRIAGVKTNLSFLIETLGHPAFHAARIDTGFIARHMDELLEGDRPTHTDYLLAAIALRLTRSGEAGARAAKSSEPHSPWNSADGWRMNHRYIESITLALGGTEHTVTAVTDGHGWEWMLDGEKQRTEIALTAGDREIIAVIDDEEVRCGKLIEEHTITIMREGRTFPFCIVGEGDDEESAEAPGAVVAPMPGKIIEVLQKNGATVKAGDALVIMEAMKMEYTLTAPRHGTVDGLRVKVGEQVADGQVMLTVIEGD